MTDSTTTESWQAEADLLADGREVLERQCATTRYRHLFPTGPNMALLFRAYQELDRWRTVHRRSPADPRTRRGDRRRFHRLLKRLVRADAIARDRRLLWHYPLPRPRRLRSRPPELVLEALHEIDADTRRDIAAIVHGRDLPEPSGVTAASSMAATSRVDGRTHRGLEQFRDALINAALAHPKQIPRLHPQYLQFMASPQPVRRKHPIATMLLVKLPLQLLMILVLLFNVAYLGAYHFFNDERLAEFLTDKIGGLLDGQIAFGKLHWSPMLIVDLVTGRPHTLHGYDVEVWEPYKVDGVEKSKRTAYAEHVEVELVIHEIIPWNRLGIPELLEIPWVLHFEEIQNHGELWVDVRAYQNPHRDGEWMLSLINAFDTYVDLEAPAELKKLSYQIDRGHLDGLVLTLDLEQRAGWATRLEFDEIEVGLDFEGWAPAEYADMPEAKPETLPLRYEVSARGGRGDFVIANIHDGPIPIGELGELEIASGMNYRPIGDLWMRGEAELGGSPSAFEGRLLDPFGDLRFDFSLGTTDLGPIAELLLPPKADEAGRMRTLVAAQGSPASLKATGPADDVVLQAVGQNLTLDLFPEPAWALDDVDVSLFLARDPRPDIWPELPTTPAAAVGGADAEEPDDGQRWIVSLDTLRGSALDGSVRLHRRSGEDHIVLPADDEPWLVSLYLDLIDVDLGQLAPSDPDLGGLLAGSTSGGLQIHQVVLGAEGLDHAEAELQSVAITRDHGPADDHLPRNIRADGEVIWDAEDGVDLRGLRIGVDGGQLRISGALDPEFEQLAPTTASVRVDNGEAFLRAFGLPRWFDSLAADFSASGPLSNPHGAGRLDVAGAGSGALAVDDIHDAALEFRRGTLSLTSPNVEMLGGRGPLSADLVLLGPKGKPLADPKLRVALRLEDINRPDILGSGIGAQRATIKLDLDDGSADHRPVAVSSLQARGSAYAETLTLADVDYRDAEAKFAFTREGIDIERLNLDYHRPVSPALDRRASVPVGTVRVTGNVGFDEDPRLDLVVRATNLPLSAISKSLDADLPVRGKIAHGSKLDVSGSLRRPDIQGQLVLAQLGAAGIPLGGGVLQFKSSDVPYQAAEPERAATNAHRQIKIEGDLTAALFATADGVASFDRDGRRLRIKPDDGSEVHELVVPATRTPQVREGEHVRAGERLVDPPKEAGREGELDWRIDATVAFGGGSDNPIEAAVDLSFSTLPLDTLLAHPSREQWAEQIVGGLHGLAVAARYCPSHEGDQSPLLSACAKLDPEDPRPLAGEAVRIDLGLAQLWYRGRREGGAVSGGDPCMDRDTTCSINSLSARLDGSVLTLAEPWRVRSGGKQGPELIVDGSFDLAGDELATGAGSEPELGSVRSDPPEQSPHRCVPGVPDNASLPPGTSAATIAGGLDFSAIAPFLGSLGVDSPVGHFDIGLDVSGVITQPTVTGFIRLPKDEPLELSLADDELDERGRQRSRPLPIEVSQLDLRMAGGTVYLDGAVELYDELLRFGEINNRPSFLDLAGPCSGRFGLSAAGSIDGALIRRLVPDLVESSGGAIELRDFHAAGDLARLGGDDSSGDDHEQPDAFAEPDDPFAFTPADPLLDILSGTLSLDPQALRLSVADIGEVLLTSGIVELRQCTPSRPCGSPPSAAAPGETVSRRKRGVTVSVAGRRSAGSTSKPSDALTVRVGDHGRADLWGELVVSDTFDRIDSATLTVAASNFPLALADNSGRTELEATLSSDRLSFETDGLNGRISGEILVDHSTWLRDARQGIAVLSFADPYPAPPSQLPEFIRSLELDMELRTGAPFRIDNNVANQLEARADLRLSGTIGDPDLSGTIDVERGIVDIDILGGAYDVARGRVLVSHNLAQSAVDLWAVRQKQIKINNQLLTLNLHLSGTLDAIQWECTAPGDTSGALSTARGCVDYLIFDAGNTDSAMSDVRDSRNNNNNLLGTRFLPLAGRLAQVEINEVLAREVPRVENYLPYVRFRVDQLGVVIEAETRPEWLRWGWGRLGLNLQYTRGYPGSVIRDSRSFSGRLEVLENAALEATFGLRNFTNRVLIVDPPNYQSIQYRQRAEIPSAR
ncbi:hypothetical protein ENSA5_00220 [Enhygromyxa salina]|uniref:Translocation and assembly module TamB C-terminal domain-containing protein n=1 Tax=Enhygromyxa salina TaxID=215803 RepID=A0A2S9YLC5_9BACT|nr:translocation/assembly module TamB domain-containing protein [Enhygromyxa salina]PRQ05910.1 hypothetical protein ENSA5_00220 [Enhygromyxa salina]